MPDSRGAALARIAVNHPGQLVAVAGGLGYLLGYINMRAMAVGLGVGPADLGLTTNDHLISAAAWVVVFIPLVAFFIWMQRGAARFGWRSGTGLWFAMSGLALAAFAVANVGASVSVFWATMMLLVVGIAAWTGWWLGGLGLSLTLTISVSFLGFVLPISHESGKQLRLHPELGDTTPPWLKVVLAFDEGQAQFPSGTECALRISERVYVTAATVRIEPSAVAFQSDDCFTTR